VATLTAVKAVQVAELVTCSPPLLVAVGIKADQVEALAVCSHHSLAPATNMVVRAVELAVCCHRSQAVVATALAVVACLDRVTWTTPALVALRATGPHSKAQALRRKDTEVISNQAMVDSHLQASSQETTMRTRQLTSRAMRHHMLSLHSKPTMALMVIFSNSSSSSNTVKVDTGNKDTTVDTSTVKAAKVVGTELMKEADMRHDTMHMEGEQLADD
jgi:hypothetical protein